MSHGNENEWSPIQGNNMDESHALHIEQKETDTKYRPNMIFLCKVQSQTKLSGSVRNYPVTAGNKRDLLGFWLCSVSLPGTGYTGVFTLWKFGKCLHFPTCVSQYITINEEIFMYFGGKI